MVESSFADCVSGQTIGFLGRPAVGKDDQSGRFVARLQKEGVLSERIKFMHMSALIAERKKQDDDLGNRIVAFESTMNAGGLLPDNLVLELVSEFMETVDPGDVLVCNGFPRNWFQVTRWREVMRRRQRFVMIELVGSRELCLARIAQRNEERLEQGLTLRSDDNSESALKRQFLYEDETGSLLHSLAYFRIPRIRIDANAKKEEVEARIIRDLGIFVSTPAARHSSQPQIFSPAAVSA